MSIPSEYLAIYSYPPAWSFGDLPFLRLGVVQDLIVVWLLFDPRASGRLFVYLPLNAGSFDLDPHRGYSRTFRTASLPVRFRLEISK